MRALIAFAMFLLSAVPGWAADKTWAGQWDTRWHNGGALVGLTQQGSKVTGTYPAYGGQIEGEVRGRELQDRWIEGPRSGGITFVLAADGQSFMGRFDTGEWWTGGRARGATAGIALDQAGARQAVRTFVMAGNAARSGNPNEWAKAAAVMDFGDAGASMAPGQKLAAARALFELVDHGTRPDQLGAFLDGIAALVSDMPHVQPGSVQVGVAALTPDGIEVDVTCTLNVRAATEERADKTALMLGVLRLADRMQVRLGAGDAAAAPAPSAVAA